VGAGNSTCLFLLDKGNYINHKIYLLEKGEGNDET